MPAAELGEGFVGALHDALAADVDPGACGHLAEHHQAFAIEHAEMIPIRPMRHQIGIGDENAGGVRMRLKNAHWLARLNQQGFVAVEPFQRRDDAIEAFPIPRRASDPAIDDQFARLFGNVGIEIVHQHAHGRFRQPGLCRELGAPRGADDACVVDTGHLLTSMGNAGPSLRF